MDHFWIALQQSSAMLINLPQEVMVWLLPSLLLFIKLFFKLSVGQIVTLASFIEGFIAMPVDIVFLSSSFTTAFIITSSKGHQLGFVWFVILLAVGFLITILWRYSAQSLSNRKFVTLFAVVPVNCLIAMITLVYTIIIVKGN